MAHGKEPDIDVQKRINVGVLDMIKIAGFDIQSCVTGETTQTEY